MIAPTTRKNSSPLPAVASARAATLLEAARAILPWMVEIRRDLHQYPELGLEEHRTRQKVEETLEGLGIEFQGGLAQTGVLGRIDGVRGPAPAQGQGAPTRKNGTEGASPAVVALRADLDALPLEEASDVPYRSKVPGKMHACGHDVHTAILLGAARLLRERSEEFAGVVKLIFQPAEETVGGAKMLIEDGVLEEPRVDAIFGLHVEPALEVGKIGIHYGQRNASSDNLAITIHGRSGHGAYPAGTVDAIVVAAQVITAIQSVVSRNVDARASAVVTLGTIQGGAQANIIANRVHLTGTIRTLDPETRALVTSQVREVVRGVAAGFGATVEVDLEPSYDPLVNTNSMVDIVRDNTIALIGEERLIRYEVANLGVEDFGFYLSHVPGAFYSLGVRNTEAGIVYPVHHERFDIDEEAMAYGAALQVLNTLSVLEGAP